MSYKLSICIPTFNRGPFLDITLENIISHTTPEVEIIIMDGASIDDTKYIVQKWQKVCPSIRYIQGAINNGVDADLATCINYAQGEYCWLMSSDDLFLETSIDRVIHEINAANYNVLLGCRIDCSKDMQPLRHQRWIKSTNKTSIFNFFHSSDFLAYFNHIDSIGALFSYISSIIVHRKSWLSVKNGDKFFGTNYAHVFRIFEMLKDNGRLLYINEPIVLCRMENDSFSSEGLVSRFKIDYLGYSKIAKGLFKSNPEIYYSMLKVLTREHRWTRLLKIRAHCRDQSEWRNIKNHIEIFGYSPYILSAVGLLGALKPLVYLLSSAYELLKKFKF